MEIPEIIKDLHQFMGLDYDSVHLLMNNGNRLVREEWIKKKPKTIKEIHNFYKTCDAYLWDQAEYKVETKFDIFVLNSIKEYTKKTNKKIKTILDFGCGIGQMGLILALDGFDVTFCDFENSLPFEFLKWRIKKYGLDCDTIPIKSLNEKSGKWDLIICLDVIEHIPTSELKSLHILFPKISSNLYLNDAGYETEKNPMHLRLTKKRWEIIKGLTKAYQVRSTIV